MRLDLYQAETALIAQEQSSLLDEARRFYSKVTPSHALNKTVYCMPFKCW